MVGEIGGNDYNYAFFQKRSIEAVKAYVPLVVKSIMDVAKASCNAFMFVCTLNISSYNC